MKFRLRWLDNSFVWIRSKALGSKVGGDPTFGGRTIDRKQSRFAF